MAVLDSATIVDAALAVAALEAVGLVVLRRRLGLAGSATALLANLGAGLALMLALRAALAGAAWPWLAACLAVAGAAHAVDLVLRRRAAVADPRRQGLSRPPQTR